MLLTAREMKAAEEEAFASGATPEGLMEVAGEGIFRCIRQFFPKPESALVYCGKGHNAGDALVAARHLREAGWRIFVRLAFPPGEMAPLTKHHLESLRGAEVLTSPPDDRDGPLLLIDGLLGIGATAAPRGSIVDLIREMNGLRRARGAFAVAVDLPSGLEATTGEVFDSCIRADLTVTLGFAKTGLLADGATGHVGRLALVPLPGVKAPLQADDASLTTAAGLRALIPPRDFDTHKGNYGRIGIVAGSPGYLGAARLCSSAAVHAGGGLVTLYCLPESHEKLSLLTIPEVMVKRVESYAEVLEETHDVLAIGPGSGREHDQAIRDLVEKAPIPCVVDADALNAIAGDVALLDRCAGPRLLTPHPGEMERLDPQRGRSRLLWAEQFVAEHPVTLLLKGSRTLITRSREPAVFNTTGNPGMGSGGMGDVLTGVTAALIGGGHSPRNAAILGTWICGRAAEMAIFNGSESQESLSATAVISSLGQAFDSLRSGDY